MKVASDGGTRRGKRKTCAGLGVYSSTEDSEDKQERCKELHAEDVASIERACRICVVVWREAIAATRQGTTLPPAARVKVGWTHSLTNKTM